MFDHIFTIIVWVLMIIAAPIVGHVWSRNKHLKREISRYRQAFLKSQPSIFSPREPEVTVDKNNPEESLLDQYATAKHDVEILTMMLQAMATDTNNIANTLTMQQTLGRQIDLAEREVDRLKHLYEVEGRR